MGDTGKKGMLHERVSRLTIPDFLCYAMRV